MRRHAFTVLRWPCAGNCGTLLDEVTHFKTRKFCDDCQKINRKEADKKRYKKRVKNITGYSRMIYLFTQNKIVSVGEIVSYCGFVSDRVAYSMITYARKDGHRISKEKGFFVYGGKKE